MKRALFATVVALVVGATPLFGQQDAKAKVPGVPTGKPAAKSPTDTHKQPVASKSAEAPKPVPVKPPPSVVKAAAPAPASAVKAPATPSASGKAGGKPKAPTGLVAVKPKAVPAVATAAAKPATPMKASDVALSPVQQKLQQNKELARVVQAKMPGADVVSAAGGFKDLQQFVAAAHASHNLAIPFASVKAKLVSGKPTSLRQVIQELRPASSAAIEAQRAEYDAMGMLAATAQPPTPAAAPAPKAQPAKPSPKGKQ